MLPRQLRVGDLVDDYCPRERRLSNHAIVALVGDEVRQVRCTTCDGEHEYRQGKVPSSRKKTHPVPAPPAAARVVGSESGASEPADMSAIEAPKAAAAPSVPAGGAPRTPEPDTEAISTEPPAPHAEFGFHRRLIRATLPRIEGDTPARPIPEFTMHRPAPAAHGHRHGKPFRPAQGGAPHRPGGKGGFGPGRPGGQRHGQGHGEANGNTAGPRGGHGQRGAHGGHGLPPGPRPSRHGFGGKPPRGPKKH